MYGFTRNTSGESTVESTPDFVKTDQDRSGDQGIVALFESQESALLRYAYSLTGRKAVAEEIVQEVFLQLHAKWAEVEKPESWLFRSVRNAAFNHLRKSKREVLSDDGETETPSRQGGQTPDDLIAHMESLSILRNAIDSLEEQDRELIKLKYFKGLKYKEISEVTGLSMGNVGYRLHHLLRRMAQQLDSRGVEQES